MTDHVSPVEALQREHILVSNVLKRIADTGNGDAAGFYRRYKAAILFALSYAEHEKFINAVPDVEIQAEVDRWLTEENQFLVRVHEHFDQLLEVMES